VPLRAHVCEPNPPASATPATAPVALPPADAGPNPAKGHPFSCLSVRFINPSFALGQVAQHPLALAAGEVLTSRCAFGAFFQAPSADRGWGFSPLHTRGHTRVCLHPIQSDPMRSATQGGATPTPAPRQAAGCHPRIRCASPRHPPRQQPRGLQLA
jgi:hypothetical protein